MEPEAWLALATVHVLGALSPGPSLAVVLRNTLNGGTRQGVLTGLGHGIGFGLFALLVASGLATALLAHAVVEGLLQWGGTAILLYLGYTFLRQSLTGSYDDAGGDVHSGSGRTGFMQGFGVAIVNPKILAWMLAIYAPFIHSGLDGQTIAVMVAMGTCIDGGWYVAVATALAGGKRIKTLRANAHRIDGAMGVLMFVFAGILLVEAL
ncbi:MAG: threonine/homoserine/homoserine lactone efflux protein [Gammaproteobacteria bacterium]|jgi:threonine/homoserine/homoserine lactone efflux protein